MYYLNQGGLIQLIVALLCHMETEISVNIGLALVIAWCRLGTVIDFCEFDFKKQISVKF